MACEVGVESNTKASQTEGATAHGWWTIARWLTLCSESSVTGPGPERFGQGPGLVEPAMAVPDWRGPHRPTGDVPARPAVLVDVTASDGECWTAPSAGATGPVPPLP